MIKHQPHKNEVDKLKSSDGKAIFSIRMREDGNYEFYVERLRFDEDEEVYYWSQEMLPHPHIFGSIVDARAEIFAQFSEILSSN